MEYINLEKRKGKLICYQNTACIKGLARIHGIFFEYSQVILPFNASQCLSIAGGVR
jgi:hypothetical protein